MTTAARLAESADNARYASLPDQVRRQAVRTVVDTLAAARSGAADPFCASYIQWMTDLAPGGCASLVSGGQRVTAELAAHLNALPTTVLQIDEGHRRSRGHPGIHIVPAALATAEEVDSDGAALVEAVVAGYQTAVCVAAAAGRLRPELHPHGSWSTFGAAVSAAKLLGATRTELESVIEAVAAMPIAPWRGTVAPGRTVHHLYAATAAQIAVQLARAVMCGCTSQPGAVDGYYLPGFGDMERWVPEEYEITNSYSKFYPACGHAHTALDAVEQLRDEPGFDTAEVEQIDVYGYRAMLGLAAPHPATNLAARFSLPFLIGQTLVHGAVSMDTLGVDDLQDPAVFRLADRVFVHFDESLDAGYPAGRPARVVITLTDGTRRERRETIAKGEVERPGGPGAWARKIMRLVDHERIGTRLIKLTATDPSRWTARQLGSLFTVGGC